MRLKENQAVAFVHRDSTPTHVQSIRSTESVIDGKGLLTDSLSEKRSQLAAEKRRKIWLVPRWRQVQRTRKRIPMKVRLRNKNHTPENNGERKRPTLRNWIYIQTMKPRRWEVIPSINTGRTSYRRFRFEYEGPEFQGERGTPFHVRWRIMGAAFFKIGVYVNPLEAESPTQLLGKLWN